jgi:RNA recognition motif-containing protein
MDTQVNPNKLFIGNLPYSVTEDQLNEMIAPHGTIVSLKLITDRETGRSRGIAFAELETEAMAEAVIAALNETEVDGRNIRVNVAQPKAPRRDFGGGGNGGYRGGSNGGSSNGGYRSGGNDRRY